MAMGLERSQGQQKPRNSRGWDATRRNRGLTGGERGRHEGGQGRDCGLQEASHPSINTASHPASLIGKQADKHTGTWGRC